MDYISILILLVAAYFLWLISQQLTVIIRRLHERDLIRYPLFDEGDLASERDEALKYGKEATRIWDDFIEKRKLEDPKSVKKNAQLSDELKNLVSNFYEENETRNYKWRSYGAMLKANAEVSAGDTTLDKANDDYMKVATSTERIHEARDRYKKWLTE